MIASPCLFVPHLKKGLLRLPLTFMVRSTLLFSLVSFLSQKNPGNCIPILTLPVAIMISASDVGGGGGLLLRLLLPLWLLLQYLGKVWKVTLHLLLSCAALGRLGTIFPHPVSSRVALGLHSQGIWLPPLFGRLVLIRS